MGGVDFVNLTIRMKNFVYVNQPAVVIRYGKFLQTIISLMIVALALFFFIKGLDQLKKIAARKHVPTDNDNDRMVTDQVHVLREIRDILLVRYSSSMTTANSNESVCC
jgi:large conductance mechanosensitive channel